MARKVGQTIIAAGVGNGKRISVISTAEEGKIYFVGVQGIPGTRFGLNSQSANLQIGRSCIYELDLTTIDNAFIKDIYIPDCDNQVIVDYIYEGAIVEEGA